MGWKRLRRLRRARPIEAETMTPIGEAVDTAEHRRYAALLVLAVVRVKTPDSANP
jgi:hypothetical protein